MRRGEAFRERRDRPFSGPNIPEAQRHTVRIRLRRDAYELAAHLARARELTVAAFIAEVLQLFGRSRGRDDAALLLHGRRPVRLHLKAEVGQEEPMAAKKKTTAKRTTKRAKAGAGKVARPKTKKTARKKTD